MYFRFLCAVYLVHVEKMTMKLSLTLTSYKAANASFWLLNQRCMHEQYDIWSIRVIKNNLVSFNFPWSCFKLCFHYKKLYIDLQVALNSHKIMHLVNPTQKCGDVLNGCVQKNTQELVTQFRIFDPYHPGSGLCKHVLWLLWHRQGLCKWRVGEWCSSSA